MNYIEDLKADKVSADNKSWWIWKHIERFNKKIEWIHDSENIEKLLKIEIKKFLHYWKTQIKSWVSIDLIREILSFIDSIFDNYDIKKLYNLSTSAEIKDSLSDDAIKLFINNIVLYKRDHWLLKNSRWWSCYDWVIFLYKMFEIIDPEQTIEKKIISFSDSQWHIWLLITYQGKSFLLDLFAKEAGKIVEIVPWAKIYLWVIKWNNTFWYIWSQVNPISIMDKEWSYINFTFQDIGSLVSEKKENKKIIFQVKTYLNWEALELQISDIWEHYGIYFMGNIIRIPKKSFVESVKRFSIDGTTTSFEIMEEILWILNEPFRSHLRYVCEKIPAERFLKIEWLE